MKPSIGLLVATLGVLASNGTDVNAAVITRVWSNNDPADGAPVCINVSVFPDMPHASNPSVVPQGSIYLYETRAEAEAAQAKVNAIGENGDFYKKRGLSGPMVAFWPDRG